MPYWHIIKVEHIRLRTVLFGAMLIFFSFSWTVSPLLLRSRESPIVHAQMQNISHTVERVILRRRAREREGFGTKKMCVLCWSDSIESRIGEKYRQLPQLKFKQAKRLGRVHKQAREREKEANNWTMKYIHAVHHRTTRSNRKKTTQSRPQVE